VQQYPRAVLLPEGPLLAGVYSAKPNLSPSNLYPPPPLVSHRPGDIHSRSTSLLYSPAKPATPFYPVEGAPAGYPGLYPGGSLAWPPGTWQRRSLRTSYEDVRSSKPGRDKRGSKLSLKLVRKLSRLLSPGSDDGDELLVEYHPVDVHLPTRSRSLEGEQRILSRRQILASLVEEETYRRMEETHLYAPPLFQDCSLYARSELDDCGAEYHEVDRVEHWQEEDGRVEDWRQEDMEAEKSSSESRDDSGEDSSESGSLPGGRFSRFTLLQAISREEISLEDNVETQPIMHNHARTTADSNQNSVENSNENSSSQKTSYCDNAKGCLPNDNEEDPVGSVWELQLGDLQWVGTLGVGGFGRVELVTAGNNNNHAFALKKMKKAEIEDEKQQQHILNEAAIMTSCSSPFIVKLYRTFKDTRYLYMLMEPCLGGELWTLLRNQKKFDDNSSRFYTACVIKALDYLHEKGIVYRDLKPENLLLDSAGYVKLTDFGFAKKLETGEKGWTFCGTPEYVAPEIITNKSHDHRADIWSVGILMYELLNGIPPFSKKSGNSQQVYSDILKGMKTVSFPSFMSSTAVELIRQLCRLSPGQRPSLSVTKRYMWFAGMDWAGLETRSLAPPHLPKIAGTNDISNFDNYGKEEVEPAEDFSEWDSEF